MRFLENNQSLSICKVNTEFLFLNSVFSYFYFFIFANLLIVGFIIYLFVPSKKDNTFYEPLQKVVICENI